MKSPTSPLPRPLVFGPGARTLTASSVGCFPMPVQPVSLCGLGRGRPMLTESSRATVTGYVSAAKKGGDVSEEFGAGDQCMAPISIHDQLSVRQPERRLRKHFRGPEEVLRTADHQCLG